MRNAVTCFAVLSLSFMVPYTAFGGPTIMMDDPADGIVVPGSSFTFGTNESGGGFLPFVNGSGNLWRSLTIDVIQPVNTVINCGGGAFYNSCTISPRDLGNGTAVYSLNFNARSKTGGIQNLEAFELNLNDPVGVGQPPDPSGIGSWGASVNFSAEVVDAVPAAAPEPGSMSLLLAGLGMALAVAQRRRTHRT